MKFSQELYAYYTPLLATFKDMTGYRTSGFIGGSILSAASLEAVSVFLRVDFLGVTVGMLVTVALLILTDWWTGSVASQTTAVTMLRSGDQEGYEKNRIKSTKITFTIFKFISLYLWLVLSHNVYELAIENGLILRNSGTVQAVSLHTVLRIFSIVPIILFGFREFISIGENINKIYGKTPYLFVLGERMFEILQFNFLSKLKSAELPVIDKDQNVNNN
jgi:hypothetical protein